MGYLHVFGKYMYIQNSYLKRGRPNFHLETLGH